MYSYVFAWILCMSHVFIMNATGLASQCCEHLSSKNTLGKNVWGIDVQNKCGGEYFGRLCIYIEGNQVKVCGQNFGKLIINHQIHGSCLLPKLFTIQWVICKAHISECFGNKQLI